MHHPSLRRASGARSGSLARRSSWFLAQLLVIAVAALTPAFVSASPASSQPTAPSAGDELPSLPPGVVNDCPSGQIFYLWKYNDSATVGVDKGCATQNDVTRAQDPDLIATLLHVSCSDTISPDGVPTKSNLGDPARRVAAYVIQKDRKICGRGNPAEDPKTDVEIVKTASKVLVTSGEEITYTLKVRNVGTSTAHNVIVSDVIQDGATFVSASAGCTYNSTTRRVTCDAGDLPVPSSTPGGSCTGKAIYYKWEYNDSATVGIDEGCSTTNNVDRTINPNLVATLLHVSCSDTISPDGVPTKSILGDPARRVKAYFIRKSDGKTCGQGTFSNPEPKQFTIRVKVTKSHCNTGTVTMTEPDDDPSNNTSTVCIKVPGKGYLEICKSSANGITGIWSFVVEGKTYKVPAGACSSAIQVESGTVTVKEKWVAGYSMTGATTLPADRLISVDKPNRTIKVEVVAGGINKQTVLTVTNKAIPGTLKVCEVAGTGVAEGTLFTFTNSANSQTISVPAGPGPGGYCAVFGGTFSGTVTVTQTAKTGYPVSDIGVEPAERFISRNLASRTATVRIAGGVTEVTYTNVKNGSPYKG